MAVKPTTNFFDFFFLIFYKVNYQFWDTYQSWDSMFDSSLLVNKKVYRGRVYQKCRLMFSVTYVTILLGFFYDEAELDVFIYNCSKFVRKNRSLKVRVHKIRK